jgi:outer membrane protein assembly factor BamB
VRLGAPAMAALLAYTAPAALAQDWAQFAGGPSRVAVSAAAPPLLRTRLIVDRSAGLGPVSFTGQSGVAVQGGIAAAVGRVGGQAMAMGISIGDGSVLWAAPVEAPFVDSWSTPAFGSGAAVFASGRSVYAFDRLSGALLWRTQLNNPVVNASPLITADRGPANRIFITDYDGFGGSARLYCLNADPFSASNPYQPGEIVWSTPIGGSSGNSPAYWTGMGGVVFVASITDESASTGGRVLAFPAGAADEPAPLWVYAHPSQGFFGGVCVSGGADPAVYAATYSLFGGQVNSSLVKLDAATGALRWSVPCARTSATPVPLPDARVVVSGGVVGFGSAPAIELFQDNGTSASLLWDSALATWSDANSNGVIDPGECLRIGGWTQQPVAIVRAGEPVRLLAGTIPAGGSNFAPCTDLYLLDLSRPPTDPLFITDHLAGAGNSPAPASGMVVTIGAAGVYALHSCPANCDRSLVAPVLNVLDFNCFLNAFASGAAYANCDRSTAAPVLNVLDFNCFLNLFSGGCP